MVAAVEALLYIGGLQPAQGSGAELACAGTAFTVR
jgi:hypothetical protein